MGNKERKWEFNDRAPVSYLLDRKRRVKVGKKFIIVPQITLRDMIDFYLFSKWFKIIEKYKARKFPVLLMRELKLLNNVKLLKELLRKIKLRRLIRFILLERKYQRRAQKIIYKSLKVKIKKQNIFEFIKKIQPLNPNPFKISGGIGEACYLDRNFESWPYIIMDKFFSNYSWSEEYVLKMSYPKLMEYLAVLNNRTVNDKTDNVSASISGHVGSGKIYSYLTNRYMKRKVYIPKYVKKAHDIAEHRKLLSALGGHSNN